jgi:hypothetical protein
MFWTISILRLAMALGGLGMTEHCQPLAAPPMMAQAVSAPQDCPHPVLAQPSVACPAVTECPAYRLSMRQTGEGANTMTWPRVTTSENGCVKLAAYCKDKAGNNHLWTVSVRHCGTDGRKATFEVQMSGIAKGKSVRYFTRTEVRLGKEKVLALGGNTPEPLCLSLRAERLPTAPVTAAARTMVPTPVQTTVCLPSAAPSPILANPAIAPCMPAQSSTYLPPPMPVASWRPVPTPMPAPTPVTYSVPVAPPAPMLNTFPSFPMFVNRPISQVVPVPTPMLPYHGPPPEGPPMDRQMLVPPVDLVPHIPPVFPMVRPVNVVVPAPMPLRMHKTAYLVKENGKSRVELRGAATSSKATRMTCEEGVCGKLHLSAGKKFVHVSGEKWKAQADKVELTIDGRVLLSGHVRLTCDKFGEGSTVKGDKVGLRVQYGRLVELLK